MLRSRSGRARDWSQMRLLRWAVQRKLASVGLHTSPGEDPLAWAARRVVLTVEDDLGNRYVAKSALGQRVQREANAHRELAAAGIPVPRLHEFLPGRPEVLVAARLAGPALSDDGAADDWQAAGRLLRTIHRVPLTAVRTGSRFHSGGWMSAVESQVRSAIADDLIEPSVASELLDVAGRLRPMMAASHPVCAVHGDCMPKHLVFDDKRRLHAIDVETAGSGDPAWDIAVLCAFHLHRLDDVLDGYDALAGEERRIRAVFVGYVLERLVRSINWNAANGDPFDASTRGLVGAVELARRQLAQ